MALPIPDGETPYVAMLAIYGLWEVVKVLLSKKSGCSFSKTCLDKVKDEDGSFVSKDEQKMLIEHYYQTKMIEERLGDVLDMCHRLNSKIRGGSHDQNP